MVNLGLHINRDMKDMLGMNYIEFYFTMMYEGYNEDCSCHIAGFVNGIKWYKMNSTVPLN